MRLKFTSANPIIFDKLVKRKINWHMDKWSSWFSRYSHERSLWNRRFGEKNKPQRCCGASGDIRDHSSFVPVILPFVLRDLISIYLLNGHDLEERRQEEELLSAGPSL